MIRLFLILILLSAALCANVVAQEERLPLTADEIAQFVPLRFAASHPFYMINNGMYAVVVRGGGEQIAEILEGNAFQPGFNPERVSFSFEGVLIDVATGAELFDLGVSAAVYFVGDDQLLWISGYDTQSARLYQLPDMQEIGRFALGVRPEPRRYGTGFLYRTQNAAFYQRADLGSDPVLLASNLGYISGRYAGDMLEMPDEQTVLIAGVNGILLVDIETGTLVKRINYPSGAALQLNEEGTRLSAITNQGNNWLVYDLVNDTPLLEVYGGNGVNGAFSPNWRYVAVTRRGQNAAGSLAVYDLETGETLHTADNVQHEIPDYVNPSYIFVGNRLVYLRALNGMVGSVSVYDITTDTLYDTDIQAWSMQTFDDTMVQLWMSTRQDARFILFDVATASVTREFETRTAMSADGESIVVDRLVFGMPTETHPELSSMLGRSNGVINVRSVADGVIVNTANGRVYAVGRDAANEWIYLSSHGGWVAQNVVSWEGNTQDLPVMP